MKSNITKMHVQQHTQKRKKSERMFRKEMWWYTKGCLWLLTVNGLCQRLGTLPPGAQYHAPMEKNQRFASVPALRLTVPNVATCKAECQLETFVWCSMVKPLCVSTGNFRRFRNCYWVWNNILNNTCSRAHELNVKIT